MAADRPVGAHFVTRSPAVARHAMAATSQPLATIAALDMLKQGGSAVDAAIAANAVLCLTEPTGCGLGGDLFAIVWDAETKQLYGLNASGRSPQALTMQVFHDRELDKIPRYGPLPVTVPGCVDGWAELHGRFGKLPLEKVLAPAIGYSREGFPVTEVIAGSWERGVELMREYPGFTDVFAPNDRAPRHGELFRNPGLADTLEQISHGGRDAFYKGDIARTIDAFMKEVDGYMRYEDLASHHSQWVAPISARYRGYDVWELPPNGQGLAALQILRMLEEFDVAGAGFGSPDHVHQFVEAKKLAFEDRAKFYADMAFYQTPIKRLLSEEYTKQRRGLIDPEKASKDFEAGNPALEAGDTVYLTIADENRNMVSLIQSNYRGFGSGLCPPGLGFCLQDRGELFDLDTEAANCYAPGKRPFHTIIPAFLTREGRPVMSFGVMGGDMQPQGHVQILLNLLDFKMGLQEAGDAPRIRHVGNAEPTGADRRDDGGAVQLENGFSPETERELVSRGHQVMRTGQDYGGYQAIWYDAENDVYFGASESRKDGMAAGF